MTEIRPWLAEWCPYPTLTSVGRGCHWWEVRNAADHEVMPRTAANERMAAGDVTDVAAVRAYLDAARARWS